LYVSLFNSLIISCDGRNKHPYVHNLLDVKKAKMLHRWEKFNTQLNLMKQGI